MVYENAWFEKQAITEIKRWKDAERHIPTQEEIATVAMMFKDYLERGGIAAVLGMITLPSGIGVSEIYKDQGLIYWEGDPVAKALIAAGIEDLPELLVCEDQMVRDMAQGKLESLLSVDDAERR